MKPQLHIANTFFESELEQPPIGKFLPAEALINILKRNPIYLQLQFLPFLYASEGDAILVSHPPPPEYASVRSQYGLPNLTIVNLNGPPFGEDFELVPWGHSELLAKWADSHGLKYPMPPWPIVQEVNSKAFSFQNSPKLPQATLLHNSKDAERWLKEATGKRVLKTCYGLSGRGHLHLESDTSPTREKMDHFLEKEWKQGRPVIAEPWVDRILDFSTQWTISEGKKTTFLGATLCENAPNGQYRCNRVGDEATLFASCLSFLAEHKVVVREILEKIAEMGYFGPVGIDAMIYLNPETKLAQLHPVVEINARKTMGWVAIAFQHKYHPHDCIEFQFCSGTQGLLPSTLTLPNGKQVQFKRNLQTKKLENLNFYKV